MRVVAGTVTAIAWAQPGTSKNIVTRAADMTGATTRIADDTISAPRHGERLCYQGLASVLLPCHKGTE